MKVSMHQVIDLNSSLNKRNEASHISFMDENKSRVSVPQMIEPIQIYLGKSKLIACCSLMKPNWKQNMHVNKFDLNLAWWVDASCMLKLIAWKNELNLIRI